MPIIHNFTDRAEKKLNIKILSWFLIIFGAILLSFFLARNQQNFKLPKNNQLQVVDSTNYICLNNTNETLSDYISTYITEKNLDLQLTNENKNKCSVTVVRNPLDTNEYTLVWQKLFVVVTNIKSELTSVKSDTLISSFSSQKLEKYDIIWNREVDEFLRTKYTFGVGQTIYSDNQIEKKLSEGTNTIAIIPFEVLNPKYKVLTIDSWDIFSSNFSTLNYPFSDTYWYSSSTEFKQHTEEMLTKFLPAQNFQPNSFTKLILTGSSYIGADAYNLNILGGEKPDYMVTNLKDIISKDDVLHISNEVSIYNSCLQKVSSTYLCSFEKDFLPLKTLGVDVVGVTGNHILDFGYKSFSTTLDWYTKNKIQYFGGGRNAQDAHTPKIVQKNGIKFAFLGYNFIPPYSYYSTKTKSGSANVSLSFMKEDISSAKKLADFVIVDMQWGDEQQTKINSAQKENALYAIKYGADIVNGVNSFAPLGFDLSTTSSTFYGLGGFLNPQTKEGIIVTHTYYQKKHIAIEITPIVYDSKKRIVLAQGLEKEKILNNIYKQSSIIYDKN